MKTLLLIGFALFALVGCGREDAEFSVRNTCTGSRSVVETGHCQSVSR